MELGTSSHRPPTFHKFVGLPVNHGIQGKLYIFFVNQEKSGEKKAKKVLSYLLFHFRVVTVCILNDTSFGV